MTLAFSKISVFVCPHVHAKRAFSKSSVFIDRFHRIRVDGNRIRKEKVAFSNQNDTCGQGLSEEMKFLIKSIYFTRK